MRATGGRLGPLWAAAGARLGPVARAVERWVIRPFPLTGLGLLVGLASTWATWHYGLGRLDLVLLVVGVVGLAVTALALVVTLVAAALIRRAAFANRREGRELGVECGFPVRTGFWLPRLWFLPFVDVSWRWLEPSAEVQIVRRHGRFIEEVTASRRGTVGVIVRLIEVGDIFGLASIAFELREARPTKFLPSVGALRNVEVIRGMARGDDLSHPSGPPEGDPFDMRRYNPGDPIKFVLWKVFARTRMLVVRTPERAVSLSRQSAAYLVAAERDEPAAGAARVALENGALGHDWVLGADGVEQTASRTDQALEVMTRSAGHPDARGGDGLAGFLQRAVASDIGRAVVFVPGRPGPWLERVVAAARSHRGAVEFIVCADGIRRARPRAWWRRLLTPVEPAEDAPLVPGASRPVTAEELAEVVSALGGVRARVMIVDRAAGRLFSPAHIERSVA